MSALPAHPDDPRDVPVRGPAGTPARALRWCSAAFRAPREVFAVDDRLGAELAVRRTRAREVLLYEGDWHNGRQLLAAMRRRLRPPRPRGPALADRFSALREGERIARDVLARVCTPVGPDWSSPLRRAPALAPALSFAFGAPPGAPGLLPLREVLGALGAHAWYEAGLWVPALGARVHPGYGVFAPVRGEYVDLLAAELAQAGPLGGVRCFDVGTGTGVLAALLARAGGRVVATDVEPAAVACARETATRLGLADRIEVVQADLFPEGRAALVVTNPPWLPAPAHAPLERAVYDPGGEVLARLVAGLRERLEAGGRALVLLSDLAERLGLRPADGLAQLAAAHGLTARVLAEAQASHPRASDAADPLAEVRRAERTKLWELRPPA